MYYICACEGIYLSIVKKQLSSRAPQGRISHSSTFFFSDYVENCVE